MGGGDKRQLRVSGDRERSAMSGWGEKRQLRGIRDREMSEAREGRS